MAKSRLSKLPLFLHKGSGQWAKKVRGKMLYFGKDKDVALKRWAEEKDRLLAGLPTKRTSGAPRLDELGNVFVHSCNVRMSIGKLSQVSIDDYKKTIKRLIEFRGAGDQPQHWGPAEFVSLADRFAEPIKRTTAIRGGIKGPQVKRRSPTTVAGDIRRTRAFLLWCAKNKLIPMPEFGTDFEPLSVKQARILRAKVGRRDFTAEQLGQILEHCSVHFKPLVLLAINGGIGNLDIAEMTLADYQGEWLDLPRGKTGTPRRVWLWPETRAAIDAYLKIRRDRGQLLFYTKFGQPWARGTDKPIGTAFTKARVVAGLQRGSFYDLRRTFATVAGETADIAAIRLVMGHTPGNNDMTALYTQHVADDRVQAVCEHVRAWLFEKK